MSLPKAVRECFLALKAIGWDSDPAPWREVSRGEVETFAEGNPEDFTLRKKLESRAMLLAQRALLRGDLKAYLGHQNLKREVPGWAWEGLEGAEDVWFHGLMQFDPQLPAVWQKWAGAPVFLERCAVMGWIGRAAFLEGGDLPAMPEPYDLSSKPNLESKRPPPPASYVSLSEALSWIAFRFSMNSEQLSRKALAPGNLSDDPEQELAEAMASLATKASGGRIELRGKYFAHHSVKDSEVLTAVIEPVRLDDFAQFDILHDGLRFGEGLMWQKGNNSLYWVLNDRGDCYSAVRVNRADLLRHFPAENELTRALFSPIPATLPDIGPVMRLDEALAIIATGKPAHDVEVWTNEAGHLSFRCLEGDIGTHRENTFRASRLLHTALKDGALQSYVSPLQSVPLSVPRLFWIGANPDGLEHTYRADEDELGEPILLSRLQFEQWRSVAKPPEASLVVPERAPSTKQGRPPSKEQILEKADEMKARGLRGYEIAKQMRHEGGFENVSTVEVRELISGRYKQAGRPKRKGAD